MADQQWEYCELRLYGQYSNGDDNVYSLGVRYYGPQSMPTYTLAEAGKSESRASGDSIDRKAAKWSFNPFSKALCLLGAAGWELVSHQYASGSDGYGFPYLRSGIKVAIFKRPVQPGRPVDVPKLVEIIRP